MYIVFNIAGPVIQLRAKQLNTANIAAIDTLLKRLTLLRDNTLNKKVFHFKKDKNGRLIMHTYQDEMDCVLAVKGEFHNIQYKIEAGGHTGFYHVVDATWLVNWMNHVDFRLIK